MDNFKEAMVKAYEESISELKKGNPYGFRILKNSLDSLAYVTEDEEILWHHFCIGTLSIEFFEEQAKVEGSKKFLSDIGEALRKIVEAYKSENLEETDRLFRKFAVKINKQWKHSWKFP